MSRLRRTTRRLLSLFAAVREFKNFGTFIRLMRAADVEERRETLQTRDGLQFRVRLNRYDARILREIFLDRPYTRHVKLPPEPVIVDIGGYIGDFSVFAAKRLNASVVVYEPTAENFDLLVENIRLNGFEDTITAVNKAVGVEGSVAINVQVDRGEVHASSYWYDDAEQRTIASVNLETLLNDHNITNVDLLKIDCEGGEYDIIDHASPDALRRVRHIALEWHRVDFYADRLARLERRLTNEGFTVHHNGAILDASRG